MQQEIRVIGLLLETFFVKMQYTPFKIHRWFCYHLENKAIDEFLDLLHTLKIKL